MALIQAIQQATFDNPYWVFSHNNFYYVFNPPTLSVYDLNRYPFILFSKKIPLPDWAISLILLK